MEPPENDVSVDDEEDDLDRDDQEVSESRSGLSSAPSRRAGRFLCVLLCRCFLRREEHC